MSNKPLQTKRDESIERQEEFNQLTPQQKIELLDKRLGKGIGAKKQREQLNKLI